MVTVFDFTAMKQHDVILHCINIHTMDQLCLLKPVKEGHTLQYRSMQYKMFPKDITNDISVNEDDWGVSMLGDYLFRSLMKKVPNSESNNTTDTPTMKK